MQMTNIQDLGEFNQNHIFIKREDLIPFSFGGNKARKAVLFFQEIEKGGYDSVVTYGAGSSNHCRVIANMCCQKNLDCSIIIPQEASDYTFNSRMIKMFGAKSTIAPVRDVKMAIDEKLKALKKEGKKPYFIQGGGHGKLGTEAYVRCYEEIKLQEKELNTHFDYIFLASGTGTTQAGLICGQLKNNDDRKIIGISIARKNPEGRKVVIESVCEYLNDEYSHEAIESTTFFIDEYTNGYGQYDDKIENIMKYVMKAYGIPLDSTYTGKAFLGMNEYISNQRNKNILFVHTGGTPLFFDALNRWK